jgi:hypothetical protein
MKYILVFVLSFFAANSLCIADEDDKIVYEELTEIGTEKNPLVIDLKAALDIAISTEKGGVGYIHIKNMHPLRRDSYRIKINQMTTAPVGLDRPIVNKKTPDESELSSDSPDDCGGAQKFIDKIENDEFKSDSMDLDELRRFADDATLTGPCQELIASYIDLSETRIRFNADVGTKTSISVSIDSSTHKAEIEVKPVEWVTHIGFTFASNKENKYYSREVPETGEGMAVVPAHFEIARQVNRGSIDYAATVLFTYPMCTTGSIKWGPTAGLAADTNTVGVVAGISAIFNHNIVLALGVEVKQFDELKGIYVDGQNIGSKATDSADLTDKQYKAAPMISLGYKFK